MVVDMTDENNDDATKKSTRPTQASRASKSSDSPPSSSWWSLPVPIRRVFDRFPLVTYPANSLPQRSPGPGNDNILYIFQTDEPASQYAPSYNPSCLKWQAYLKFHGIPLRTRPANNHASPTGSLPFLLPATIDSSRPSSPIPSNRISRWVVSQGGKEEVVHTRQEAYMALIDHIIRSAWLYYLYLEPDNFKAVAWPMYVASTSSSYFVQLSLASQLRIAARDELLKTHALIDGQELYHEAEKAFRSLSTLLGGDRFFFGQSTPGLFDASLFAYTQVILDDQLDFKTKTLKLLLQQHENLVHHRARLIRGFFSSKAEPPTTSEGTAEYM